MHYQQRVVHILCSLRTEQELRSLFFLAHKETLLIGICTLANGSMSLRKKLQIIDNVATNLWGKDLRDAYQIAGAVCMPIFDYIDEVLESKETK